MVQIELKNSLTILNKYNSVKGRHGFYKFDDIQIISAGERDPDSDDVSGMSASKMRLAATENDFESFKTGVPDQKHADKLWKAVRRGMNLKEIHYHLTCKRTYLTKESMTKVYLKQCF